MFTNSTGLYVGRIESHNISDIKYTVSRKPDLISSFDCALILCLDSNRNPNIDMPSIAKIIQRRDIALYNSDRGIATNGRTIVKLATEENIFNGFDEVWFFRKLPISIPPEDVYIMSDIMLPSNATLSYENQKNVQNFLTWRSTTEAIFGLSDGTGLNYFTINHAFAESLEMAYQP